VRRLLSLLQSVCSKESGFGSYLATVLVNILVNLFTTGQLSPVHSGLQAHDGKRSRNADKESDLQIPHKGTVKHQRGPRKRMQERVLQQEECDSSV
jgi:hypothetical protein